MQLNQFKFLVAVDQYGSISRAAQELYISQSTVSMALIAMEEELGVTLLSRGKKGVAITEEGKLVLEKAKVIMNEVNALQATSFDYETLTGEVFVGGSSHLCMNIITDMAIQMKQLHPAVSILTKRQNTKDIIKSIAQKELDIGFIHYNTLNEYDILAELRRYHMEWVPLFQDKQCICVSDHHPLYGKKSLPIETLFPYEIVSLASRMDEFMYSFFSKKGYQKKTVSINDIANQRKYAVNLDAMIIMPETEIEKGNRIYTDHLYQLDVPEFDSVISVGLTYRSEYYLSLTEQKVVEILEAESKRYLGSNR